MEVTDCRILRRLLAVEGKARLPADLTQIVAILSKLPVFKKIFDSEAVQHSDFKDRLARSIRIMTVPAGAELTKELFSKTCAVAMIEGKLTILEKRQQADIEREKTLRAINPQFRNEHTMISNRHHRSHISDMITSDISGIDTHIVKSIISAGYHISIDDISDIYRRCMAVNRSMFGMIR